jgi:hypothetical protein
MDPQRAKERAAGQPNLADELTVTLWCLAALLGTLLTAYWFAGTIYS